MKFSASHLLLAVVALSSTSAASLRATCVDAPEPTPAPTTSTPTPAPTTLEAPFVFLDVNGVTMRSGDEPQLDKCHSWDGCIRSRDALGTIAWERLGPAGSVIQFYKTAKCGGDEFESFAADAPNAFASPEITEYHTFVVRSSLDAAIDRSDAFGCQK